MSHKNNIPEKKRYQTTLAFFAVGLFALTLIASMVWWFFEPLKPQTIALVFGSLAALFKGIWDIRQTY